MRKRLKQHKYGVIVNVLDGICLLCLIAAMFTILCIDIGRIGKIAGYILFFSLIILALALFISAISVIADEEKAPGDCSR